MSKEMDFTTPNDRHDDPGLDEPTMIGPMEPVVPCEWMPTRHCVARWDTDETGAYEIAASVVCPKICWRYNRPVEDRGQYDEIVDVEANIIVSQESIIGE